MNQTNESVRFATLPFAAHFILVNADYPVLGTLEPHPRVMERLTPYLPIKMVTCDYGEGIHGKIINTEGNTGYTKEFIRLFISNRHPIEKQVESRPPMTSNFTAETGAAYFRRSRQDMIWDPFHIKCPIAVDFEYFLGQIEKLDDKRNAAYILTPFMERS